MNKILFSIPFVVSQLIAGTILNWEQLICISTPGVNASNPDIVIDNSGNTTAIWLEETFVKARNRPYQQNWGNITSISGGNALKPQLDVDGNGNVVAIWLEDGIVYTASMPSTGIWGTQTPLSNTGASQSKLVVNNSGDAIAIWCENGFVKASIKKTGGDWAAPQSISQTGKESNPDIALNDNGDAIAVWSSLSNGQYSPFSSKGGINKAWGSPVSIYSETGIFQSNYPKVAIDSNGNATVIWFYYSQSGSSYSKVNLLSTNQTSSSDIWEPNVYLLTQSNGLRDPSELESLLQYDSNGNALSLWTTSYDGQSFNVEFDLLPYESIWGNRLVLTYYNLYSFQSDATVLPNGSCIILYASFDSTNIRIFSTETNVSNPTQIVTFDTQLIDIKNNSTNPVISSSLSGTQVYVSAAICNFDGTNQLIYAMNGEKKIPNSPTNLIVERNSKNFGTFIDYINTLSWKPSLDPDIVNYWIYRDDIYFASTDADTLFFEDHNAKQNIPITYGISAIDQYGQSSTVVKYELK